MRVWLLFVIWALCPGGAVKAAHLSNDRDADGAAGWEDLHLAVRQWPGFSAGSAGPDGRVRVDADDFAYLAGDWGKYGGAPLVINEFLARNVAYIQDEGGDYDDWIEVYNSSDGAVDMAGMYLTDDLSHPKKWQVPADDPSATVVSARGYLVIWCDEEPAEGILHAAFKLSNSGEEIGLYDTDGTLVDSLAFGPQIADVSYGRFPDAGETWQRFDKPTPGETNQKGNSDIVINEIMYHPYSESLRAEDLGAEYIELFNRGSSTVSLANWRFAKGVDFVFPDVVLGPGEYLVVAANVDTFAAGYPDAENVVGNWNGRLSNSGETLELRDGLGAVVDSVPYADEGDWSVRELGPEDYHHRGWIWRSDHDGLGQSLELINPALPNEYGPNWAAGETIGGTPGKANSVAAADVAPLIVDTVHAPVVPGPDDPVLVTAKVIDESTSDVRVTLHFRVDRSMYFDRDIYPEYEADDYTVLPMADDGEHGDGRAGDGVYGVHIPGQRDGTIVEFFVEAADAGGRSRTWPAPSLVDGELKQVTNALYRVDAAFNPYAYWMVGAQPLYYLIMTETENGRLLDIGDREGSEYNSDAQMNATFVSVDGADIKVRHGAGIRNRGHGSRNDPPNNYRVNFPHDRPWKGVTAINVNSKYTYVQLAASALFRLSGLPQPDVTAVQVRVNGRDLADPGREMYGSYVHVEAVDSDYAANHFPDDSGGNAYKCMRDAAPADFGYRGPDSDAYRNSYFKRTNVAEDDWSDLIELCRVLSDDTPDDIYVDEVSRVANVEQWLRFLAINALLDNNETTLARGYGDDYYLYRGDEDPRFVLIQHDLDSVFGYNGGRVDRGIFRAVAVPALDRLLAHPRFLSRYYFHLRDLIETTLSAGQIGPFLDNLLGGFVPAGAIDQMKEFVAQRNAYVLSLIPSELTIQSDLSINSGYPTTTAPFAIGDNIQVASGAFEAWSVLVNGQLAERAGRPGEWRLGLTMVNLSPGINRVIVEAFDGTEGTGNRVAEAYTDIYRYTGFTNDYPKEGPLDGGSLVKSPPEVNLIVRDSYLPGVPLLVRVELVKPDGRVDRDVWDATAVLSASGNSTMDLSTDRCTLYNGLGSALVTCTGTGDFILTATVDGVEAGAILTDLSDQPIHVVSGALDNSETWRGIYHVTGGDLTVPEGVTLTLEPGTLVLIDGVPSGSDGTDIDVYGSIQSLGTATSPVTFTATTAGENWGELHHVDAEPSTFRYTHITQAGHSPRIGHSNSGPTVRASGSTFVFDHASLTDNAGKIAHVTSGADLTFSNTLFARSVMGPEISGTALLFEDSWITEMHANDDADGIYIHGQHAGQECTLIRGVMADMDDDGIDTLGSDVTVEDFIVRDCKDKGISVYGGETTISYCLVVGNNTAPEDPTVATIAAKAFEDSLAVVNIDHTTVVTSRTPGYVDIGIQSHNKYGVATGTIIYNVTNSIIDATDAVDVQSPYQASDIHISDSDVVGEDWPGAGNLNADPQFVDPTDTDYRLRETSPCIGAAGQGSSGRDLGYYQQGGSPRSFEGTLSGDVLWTAEDGPYRVTSDLTVPAGMTLRILPGTTVFFEPDAKMIIEGQLLAEGAEYQYLRFTRTPETGGAWGGLQFVDSVQPSRVAYAVIEYARTDDGMVGLENSSLVLENVTFDNTDLRRIRTIDSSLIVRNSVFTDIFGPNEPPTTDNRSEHIWGHGVPGNGRFIIEHNTFGRTPGHNDAIDFDGATRPGPIPQILNNVFTGGGDDALDLETDAHIEGNAFFNYHKDRYNKQPRESNVISAGSGKDYVVVRNLFCDSGHVAQVKNDAFMIFQNNTVVDVNASAFYFEIPGQTTSPGRGVWIDSCIFSDSPQLLANFYVDDPKWGTTDIVMDRCIAPAEWHPLGEGNVDADPLFVGGGDFHLRSPSPARGAGSWGLDMGAYVPGGAVVAGEPSAVTYRTDAVLTTGGSGLTDYRYSLNDPSGPWSEARPMEMPIELTGLRDGDSYTVYVIGKNSAGIWQEQPNASRTWTVDVTYHRLVINEVLAVNQTAYEHEGTFPDVIELYYDGPAAMDLSGMTLSDDAEQPEKFVFPAGSRIDPGAHLVLFAEANAATPGIHVGFGLNAEGDEVYLYDRDGTLVDSVTFGHQLADLSIGRVGDEGNWHLTVPTFGTVNVTQPLGDPSQVKLNEWLAHGEVLFATDFIELYNGHGLPVDIGGFYLTDNPVTQPAKCELRPLTFIAADGFAVFEADDRDIPGHVRFKLSQDGELIGLFDPDLRQIDKVIHGPQTPDVSQGRSGDGSDRLEYFALPIPGLSNPGLPETTITRVVLVPEEAAKRAIVPVSAEEVGDGWKSEVAFDDASWLSASGAPGGVGYERSSGYESLISLDVEEPMYGQNNTCYVRIPFRVEGDLVGSLSELQVRVRYDDGFVLYLNGTEVARTNFSGTPQWDSRAESSHEASSQAFDAVLDLSDQIGLLRAGENLLAVQGLNTSSTSSDFVISVALEGAIVEVEGQVYPYEKELALLDGLRIMELMYHAEEGDGSDYIELQNILDEPLDVTGVRFTDGVTFTFPPMILGAGEYVVVVDDQAAFRSRYGTALTIAGAYSGHLSDRGEDIVLKLASPLEAAIMRFRYEDGWYPATDGRGRSLSIEDPTAAAVIWNDPENWRASDPTPGGP